MATNPKKLISLRLPLFTAIDDFAWKHRTDRSDIIEKSCRHYLLAIPCPQCQTINPQTGKHCALCGAELTRPDHWIGTLRDTTDIRAADPLLQTPDITKIPKIISRISRRLAELL